MLNPCSYHGSMGPLTPGTTRNRMSLDLIRHALFSRFLSMAAQESRLLNEAYEANKTPAERERDRQIAANRAVMLGLGLQSDKALTTEGMLPGNGPSQDATQPRPVALSDSVEAPSAGKPNKSKKGRKEAAALNKAAATPSKKVIEAFCDVALGLGSPAMVTPPCAVVASPPPASASDAAGTAAPPTGTAAPPTECDVTPGDDEPPLPKTRQQGSKPPHETELLSIAQTSIDVLGAGNIKEASNGRGGGDKRGREAEVPTNGRRSTGVSRKKAK